ncbi:amino acid adenylation domain-containing protein [Streptomyces sp. NPDC056921]|uniref:amino acid adenylation domain-containing protein n=1 Tax=Streptomyces sp. NPDC056921 TaxID=3345966 RepID=UPI003628E54B
MKREPLLAVGGARVPAPEAVRIPPEQAAALRHLSSDDPVGLQLLLLAATRLTLAAFGAEDDLAVLCPAPAFSGAGEVVLRTRLTPDTKVSGFLTALQDELATAADFAWQDRADLVARLDAVGGADSAAVAQLAVCWEGAYLGAGLATPAEVLVKGNLTADGAVRLEVTGVQGQVPAAMAAFPRCLAVVLAAVAADPHQSAGAVDVLGPNQCAELERWSGLPLPDRFAPRTLLGLVDASAVRGADRTAVADGVSQWTHGELADRSRRAAQYLTQVHGIGRGDRVAVALPRGADLVLAVLAVLRTGAAFVPIDPKHPAARIQNLLEGSAAKLVIGVDGANGQLPTVPAGELLGASDPVGESSPVPVLPRVHPQDDAVVFFTSGSTGSPRPVILRHDQISHQVVVSANLLGVDEELRCALLSAISSDATTYQIFLTLGVGGALVAIGAPDELEPKAFWERLRTFGVTMVNCVPSLLSTMLEVLPEDAGIELPYLLLGGDAVPRGLLARTQGRLHIGTFANLYGPSEATIACTTFVCRGLEAVALAAAPIGRPTPGYGVLLLTPTGTLAPVGVPGEMYLVGPAVAPGYLAAPEATAARFVECPLPGIGRAFRTGDLSRWNVDGTLEFLGRMDDQIQLHGNRVEPGEVEQTLVELEGIREAVVLPRALGANGLVLAAWYTADTPIAPETVRDALAGLLPRHMVPGILRQVGELPRTPHGKTDRLALAAEAEPADRWAPSDELAEAVAVAWEKVFGRRPRSEDEDFFAAGGHSLAAAQLVGALCAGPLGQELSIRQVFTARTPAALTVALRQSTGRGPGRPEAAEAGPVTETVDRTREVRWTATNAQARMWLLESLDHEEIRTYNMVEAYELDRPVDPAALEAAVKFLVDRHEALRTVFEMPVEQGSTELWQVVMPLGRHRVRPRVQRVEPQAFDAALARARAYEARWRFDLATGPLMRLRYLTTTTGRPPVLIFNIHHSVNDGWSYSVLVSDLLTAARAYERGETPRLPETAGYLAHSRALDERLSGARGEEHARYWKAALAGLGSAPALPSDRSPGPRRSNAGGSARIDLGERVTGAVRDLSVLSGATPFMVYVAAVRALLYRITGAADVPLGSVVAGRGTPDLAREVGLYVNTVVLRTGLDPQGSFKDLVDAVLQTALDAQEHEEFPFDRLVHELDLPREEGRNPLFDVLVETVISGTGQKSPVQEGQAARHLRMAEGASDFDLCFSFLTPESESAGTAEVSIGYRSDLFDARSAARIGEELRELLQLLLEDPAVPLAKAL